MKKALNNLAVLMITLSIFSMSLIGWDAILEVTMCILMIICYMSGKGQDEFIYVTTMIAGNVAMCVNNLLMYFKVYDNLTMYSVLYIIYNTCFLIILTYVTVKSKKRIREAESIDRVRTLYTYSEGRLYNIFASNAIYYVIFSVYLSQISVAKKNYTTIQLIIIISGYILYTSIVRNYTKKIVRSKI